MLALFIKITAGLFFAYISVDSFLKLPKVSKDMEDDLINPRTGKIMKSRLVRSGILFAIAAFLSFVSILFRVAPLGE